MLDTDTKRRIDSCRDILVGKVPDPKSQVEQITIALIYKFMDDMDAEAEEMGGKRSFFAGDYAKYGWSKLMAPGMGGFDVLNLYTDAIGKMNENPGIPALFRDIFKNAYLPYRDPETLRAFLKEIDGFTYDHSERLGDAFEYLLSVLGSQGDAGQFRTPRHIIDFMVEVIDPKKNETLLDPACGTAGFLISAWKHILKSNSSPSPLVGEGRGEGAKARLGDQLSPDERKQLAANLHGYDISPDMVRLSLVNMYLHGFTDPHIDEYDTLTSEERWHHYSDIILANPPFMSPKGGIKPHKRFSVQATRSEVLFVDYIAEHLTPTGRAAVIVPEGIIFQSQTAYKALRKLLVENYLVAVVSLPAGVFQPYSGVKTSILILDKTLAKKADGIGFFKVENDGYGLGAQRRPIDKNDLPQIRTEIGEYLRRLRAEESVAEFQPTLGLIVDKAKVAANDDYNLSGERYREGPIQSGTYPWVKVGEIVETITPPTKIQKTDFGVSGQFPIIDQSQNGIAGWTDDASALVYPSKPLVIFGDHTCAVKLAEMPFAQGADGIKILLTKDIADPRYLFHVLRIRPLVTDGYQRHFTKLREHEIPLPPLEMQKEIVAEIEGYQKVIDGARAVLDNYRPHIPIHPEWPMGVLADICTLISGQHIDKEDYNTDRVGVDYLTGPSDFGFKHPVATRWTSKPKVFAEKGDILMTVKGSGLGSVNLLNTNRAAISRQLMAIRVRDADPDFIYVLLLAKFVHIQSLGGGAAIPGITREHVLGLEIPLPPLATQQAIVAEIETEQTLVNANHELIARFEKKIQATLARIWGEEETAPAES